MTDPVRVSDLVWRGVQRFGDRIALEDARDGRRLSYRELYVRTQSGASELRSRGLVPGDRVIIQMDGSADWMVALMSVLHADLVAVPLSGSGPAWQHPMIPGCAGLITAASGDTHAGPRHIRASSLGTLRPGFCTVPQAGPDDVAVLALTSGGTAQPRVVQLTHRNLLSNVRSLGAARQVAADEALLSVLPPSHLFELVVGQLAPLALGARIVYGGPPLPNRLLDAIRDRRVTRVLLVPALVEALARAVIDDLIDRALVDPVYRSRGPAELLSAFTGASDVHRAAIVSAVRDRIGPAFRSVGVGGAALAPAWCELVSAAGILVEVGYGLTEAGPLVSAGLTRACPAGSVGRPVPGVRVRIDPGGEILVQGDGVTPGYLGDGSASGLVLEDGWLRTGDRGRIDANGFLFVTGRIKEAIVSAGGDTVYPDEIEPYYASPLLAESCVVPVRDPDGNDVATLVAVPAGGVSDTELDRALAMLRAAAPPRCRVARVVRHDGPLPRTALGKIQRRALGERLSTWTADNIERRVRELVADVSRRDLSALGPDDDLVASLGIDSMQGLQILAGIEKRCAVRLRDEELIEMRTVARIVRAVQHAAGGGST
jgi:long-chain acyl-CoA synthetase